MRIQRSKKVFEINFGGNFFEVIKKEKNNNQRNKHISGVVGVKTETKKSDSKIKIFLTGSFNKFQSKVNGS